MSSIFINALYANSINIIRVGNTNIKIPTPNHMNNVSSLDGILDSYNDGEHKAKLVFSADDKSINFIAILTSTGTENQKLTLSKFKEIYYTDTQKYLSSNAVRELIKKKYYLYERNMPKKSIVSTLVLPTQYVKSGKLLVTIQNVLLVKSKIFYIFTSGICVTNQDIVKLKQRNKNYLDKIIKINSSHNFNE